MIFDVRIVSRSRSVKGRLQNVLQSFDLLADADVFQARHDRKEHEGSAIRKVFEAFPHAFRAERDIGDNRRVELWVTHIDVVARDGGGDGLPPDIGKKLVRGCPVSQRLSGELSVLSRP